MHPLDDIPAIVEHSLDVLRVDGTRKVRITIVLAVAARRAYTLEKGTNVRSERKDGCLGGNRAERSTVGVDTYEKFVSDEVLGPYDVGRFRGICDHSRFDWRLVTREFREVVLQLVLARLDFLGQQILLVQKQDHRNRAEPSTRGREVAKRRLAMSVFVLE
jgi:hypothetical protein